LDIELLKTFMEVRNTRHFGRAADNLFITQAAVSARIKQLEELLGVTLFIRSRNNIQLSREGERLVPHAETMLMAWARARQDVAVEAPGASQIHLGVRTGIWNPVLQKKLYAIQRGLPEVVLRVESHPPDAVLRMLLDRTLDLAVMHEAPNLPELTCVPVGRLTLQLFSSRPRQSWQDAVAADYVYVDWGQGFARFHAKRFGEQLLPVVRTNIPELAVDYLTARGGACYLPASMRRKLGGLGLHPVRDAPAFERELTAAYRTSIQHRELIEKLLGYFSNSEL
jgi:DNA-binding transcriptional LysR family regulator